VAWTQQWRQAREDGRGLRHVEEQGRQILGEELSRAVKPVLARHSEAETTVVLQSTRQLRRRKEMPFFDQSGSLSPQAVEAVREDLETDIQSAFRGERGTRDLATLVTAGAQAQQTAAPAAFRRATAAAVPGHGQQAPARSIPRALGPLGQLWLTDEVDGGYKPRHFKRNQVLHDLLVSELAARMSETATRRGPGWAFSWAGESAASFYPNEYDPPLVAPDGLGVLRRQQAVLPFFVEVDAGRQGHGRYSSDWGRKLVGYDRFVSSRWRAHPELGHLPAFPVVLVVTRGAERLLNLARAKVQQVADWEAEREYQLAARVAPASNKVLAVASWADRFKVGGMAINAGLFLLARRYGVKSAQLHKLKQLCDRLNGGVQQGSGRLGNAVASLSRKSLAASVVQEKPVLYFFKKKTTVQLWNSSLTPLLNRQDRLGPAGSVRSSKGAAPWDDGLAPVSGDDQFVV
jgi:hypothetical protein